MHPRQHHFLVAGGVMRLNLCHHVPQVAALARAAGDSGDAKGAMVVAAVLDFNESARRAHAPRQKLAQGWRLLKHALFSRRIGNQHLD